MLWFYFLYMLILSLGVKTAKSTIFSRVKAPSVECRNVGFKRICKTIRLEPKISQIQETRKALHCDNTL